MDPHEVVLIAGRTALLYIFLLFSLRVIVTRPLRSYSALDLVTLFVIGEIASRPLCGQFPLPQALFLIVALGTVHYALSYASCVSLWFDRLHRGDPRILIRNGEVCGAALAAERLNERDLRALLREQGVERLDEVRLATLEPTGRLCVIRTEHARPLQKGDLQELLRHVQADRPVRPRQRTEALV